MVKKLIIILNPGPVEGVYTPGSIISGVLTVVIDKPKCLQKIIVYLLGRALVYWTAGGSTGSIVTHAAFENYVNVHKVVWYNQYISQSLPAGMYTHPFEFRLPSSCPSSFRSLRGNISYGVVGEVTDGESKSVYKVTHPFNVVEVISSSCFSAGPAVCHEKHRTVRVGLMKHGDISYRIQLPKTNFDVCEEIPVSWYVENGSGRRVTLRCSLVEKVKCYASDGAIAISKSTIITQTGVTISPHTASGEVTLRVPIPLTCRPAITSSNIIKSEIRLVATVKIPWAINSSIKIPVNIGNIQQQL